MKKRMMMVLTVLTAAVSGLSACGQSEAAPEAPAQEYCEDASSGWYGEDMREEDSSYAEAVSWSESGTEETAAAAPDHLPMALTGATEFRNGRAWIRYDDAGSTVLSGIDTEGNILFTIRDENTILYCAPFEDGFSWYAGKGEDGQYETIVDEYGNICYQAGTAPVSGAQEEHVLCYGNGKFVISRHISNMTADEWQLGCIDAYGNDVTEFLSCEQARYLGQTGSVSSGTMNTLYDRFDTGDDDWPVSACLGSSVYFLKDMGVHRNDILFNADTGSITEGFLDERGYDTEGWYWPLGMEDGRILAADASGEISIADTDAHLLGSYDTNAYRWTDGDASCGGGLFYRDRVYGSEERGYFDLSGQLVLSLEGLYPELDVWGYPFYDGYAVVWIRGQDRNDYATVIDRNGEQQFEPVPIGKVLSSGMILSGRFMVRSADGERLILDRQGNVLHDLSQELPDRYTFWTREPYGILRYYVGDAAYYTYFKLDDAAASDGSFRFHMPAADAWQDGTEEEVPVYAQVDGFTIEGRWKSVGDYGFGQAQPDAVIVFDGWNCNFCSPQDTYAFYPEGGWYRLDVTGFGSGDTQSFTVKTVDAEHIGVIAGGYTTELVRVG